MFVSVDVDEAADAADLPGALPTFRVYRGAKIVEDVRLFTSFIFLFH